jgi:hypothetical protein
VKVGGVANPLADAMSSKQAIKYLIDVIFDSFPIVVLQFLAAVSLVTFSLI